MRAESDRSGAMFLEVARDGSGGRDESRRARQHQIVEKIERCPVAAGARDIRAGSKRLLTARRTQKLHASRSLAPVPLANELRPRPLRALRSSCTQDTADRIPLLSESCGQINKRQLQRFWRSHPHVFQFHAAPAQVTMLSVGIIAGFKLSQIVKRQRAEAPGVGRGLVNDYSQT